MNAVIEKWEEILQTVKSEYEVTDVPFNTWLKPLKVYEVDGKGAELGTASLGFNLSNT